MRHQSRRHDGARIDRRTFLGHSSRAAAVLLVGGAFHPAWAQDIRGLKPGAVVQTAAGRIRGLVREGGVHAFFGVPYGAATAGAGRFLPPAKPTPWTAVRDCMEVGHQSPQDDGGPISEVAALDRNEPMGEDCLNLNVFTPALGSGRRPVMVWMHGGGYAGGSGNWLLYDGSNLARKEDVVVISVTHRLNAFGYLYLAEVGGERFANASNVGQKDLILALEWVRDNVAAFGGDPANVTIFGQSGGAGKISTLMAMPGAKGLFHRAIVESGSNLRGVSRVDATKSAESLLAALNLRPNQVDELQKLPWQQIEKAVETTRGLRLAPVLDGASLPDGPWQPNAPGVSAGVPLLIGSTETEVTFSGNLPPDTMEEADVRTRLKQATRGSDAQVDELIRVYRAGRPGVTNTDLYLILASDNSFRSGVVTQAEIKAAQAAAPGNAPVYMYYFTWRSPVHEGRLKAMHTMEIPFAFDNVDLASSMVGSGQDRYALADRIRAAWAAFARTGKPGHKGLPNWPAFTLDRRATMVLDRECTLVNDPHREERLALKKVRESLQTENRTATQ